MLSLLDSRNPKTTKKEQIMEGAIISDRRTCTTGSSSSDGRMVPCPTVVKEGLNISSKSGADNKQSTKSSLRAALCSLFHCVSNQVGYMRSYPVILLASLLIFVALTTVGVVLSKQSFESQEDEAYEMALAVAEDSVERLSNDLERAILPLFSVAQFATEIQVFKELPRTIGQANATQSLPFLTNEDGSFSFYRNISGVCDDPELIATYNQITATVQKNLKMEGIIGNIQLIPHGVICLSAGVVDMSSLSGWDVMNDPIYMKGHRATLQQENLGLAGPLLLDNTCVSCGLHFVARLPILSDTHQIEIDGVMYNRYGMVSGTLDWEQLIRRSKIHESMQKHGYEFKLLRTDRTYNTTGYVYDEGDVVLTVSDGFGSERIVGDLVLEMRTVNDKWVIIVQYPCKAHNPFVLAVAILGPFFVAVLVFVVLSQKQVQAALRGAAMAQEAKVEIERNMTAYFAHELRNPLGAIDCALESMPKDLPTETRELVQGMQLCSTFMASIMNNLLDVRKIEEGKMVLRSDPLSLEALVRDLCKMTLPSVRPGVELNHVVETEGRDCVLGDIHRLQQILNNVVTNAIKYTSSGSITLYAGWEGNLVRLECRDTGPGIPKEEQTNMFERFTTRGGAPGSGLGLAIAKQIVDLMNGSICFESDPTVKPGTNCVVLIPLVATVDRLTMEPSEHDVGPIEDEFSVLIIDDIKMNRAMFRKRIQKSIAPNCIIAEAATGEQALEMCKKETYDVIIVDHYMEAAGGVLVGTDVISTMRRSGLESFIIGCSGNDIMEAFTSAGADCVWGKPLPTNTEITKQFRFALEKRYGSCRMMQV